MSEHQIMGSLKNLYQLFSKREKIKVIGLTGLMIIVAMMEMVGIGAIPAFILVVASPEKVLAHPLTGPITQWFGISDSRELLIVGSVGLIGFFILKGLLTALINYIKIRFIQYKYVELSGRLFSSYMLSPYTFHLNHNSSELLRNVIAETSHIVYGVLTPLMHIALSAVTMLFVVSLLIFVEPVFSIVALAGLGLFSWLSMRFVKDKTTSYGKQEMREREVSNKAVLEGLSGIKDARVLGREESFLSRFKCSVKLMARAQFFIRMVQESIRPVFETVTVMGVLGLALFLTAKDQSIESIIAVLALFAAATYRLMPTFNQLLTHITTFRYHIFSVTPVYNDIKELQNFTENPASEKTEALSFKSTIKINALSYSYPNNDVKALDNISILIPRGSAIALIGESGAGKTTLVDVLLGLLKPQEGSILVDNVDIFKNTRGWQKCIGYIPQSIYLKDDSIKNNVAFGIAESEISDVAFWRAAEAAQLTEFIQRLPGKENTHIGEHGVRLSGGQRQRIGIARALYHNPQLLIIDEGTSALDNITETYVIDAINKLKGERTIIMIAHRLTTVQACDKLYIMENGKILDHGSYEELLKKSLKFQSMAMKQIK